MGTDTRDRLGLEFTVKSDNSGTPAPELMSSDELGMSFVSTAGARAEGERQPVRGDTSKLQALSAGGAAGAAGATTFTAGVAATSRIVAPIPDPRVKTGLSVLGGVAATLFTSPYVQKGLESAGVPAYEDILPEYRRYYVSGETFTGSLIPAAGMTVAVKAGWRLQGISRVGKWFDRNLDAVARQSKKAIAYGELTAASSAGLVTGEAESRYPGEFIPRFLAETLAGAANPARWAGELARFAWFRGRNAVTSLLPQRVTGVDADQTAKVEATRYLRQLYASSGIDPGDTESIVAATKRDQLIPGQTLHQKTGDPILAALSHALEQNSASYGIEVQKRTKDALDSVQGIVAKLIETGDPRALVAASDIQYTAIRNTVETLMQDSVTRAKLAVHNISKDTVRNSREISKTAETVLNEARRAGRNIEKELWGQLDQTEVLKPEIVNQFLHDVHDFQRTMVPEDIKRLPSYISEFLNRATNSMKGKGAPFTVNDFTALRSAMLDAAADAADGNAFNRSRVLGKYAEQALTPLNTHFEGTGNKTHELARKYSREFNDVYTRTFAGRANATDDYGRTIHPEELVRRALATGGEAADIRLQDLEVATRFLVDIGKQDEIAKAVTSALDGYDPETALALMLSSQERMIRLVISQSTDPITKRLNSGKVAEFLRANDGLLDRMGGLRDDLQRAVDTEEGLRDLEHYIPRYGLEGLPDKLPEGLPPSARITPNELRVSQLLAGVDDPRAVVGSMISSDRWLKGLKQLSNLAKKRPGGLAGLRSTILGALGDTTPQQIQGLRTPRGEGAPSLLDAMRGEGIVDDVMYKHMQKLFKEYDRLSEIGGIHQATALPGGTGTIGEDANSFLASLVGLRIMSATKLAPAGGGAIAANTAAARLSRQIIDKMPKARQAKVLEHAMLNPDFGADLLADMNKLSDKKVFQLMGRIHGYLMRAGLIPVIREEDETLEQRGFNQ